MMCFSHNTLYHVLHFPINGITPITYQIAQALHWGMQHTMQYYASQFQQLITLYFTILELPNTVFPNHMSRTRKSFSKMPALGYCKSL